MSASPAENKRTIAITGGAGFIGSNLLRLLVPKYPDQLFVNVDCLTYAGNLDSLTDVEHYPNYRFEKVDLCDSTLLASVLSKYTVGGIIHLAAETHVDRSILAPASAISTNIIGTFNLLEYCRTQQEQGHQVRFHHVSTDEVFGSLEAPGTFTEESPYRPSSPYAASKASADHLVRSYAKTFDLDTVISNCSNNYGPYQFPEKLIPLIIRNAQQGLPLPIYGDGGHKRDWLHVNDHCLALEMIFLHGRSGESYLVGGNSDITNLELVKSLCRILSQRSEREYESLIQFVAERPGHDRRYAIDHTKISSELGWHPSVTLTEGLQRTVDWYCDHTEWVDRCINGEYQLFYQQHYGNR
ncbi:MAG: dTDP-glucose 4,6-dehydratase [candidate division Zixibacteria bacterium]|mgnify:CR=1 FL=1|nr:dTDP-glucose 4,6-dehydratase [candidate division Zixibacteria bacterium]